MDKRFKQDLTNTEVRKRRNPDSLLTNKNPKS